MIGEFSDNIYSDFSDSTRLITLKTNFNGKKDIANTKTFGKTKKNIFRMTKQLQHRK